MPSQPNSRWPNLEVFRMAYRAIPLLYVALAILAAAASPNMSAAQENTAELATDVRLEVPGLILSPRIRIEILHPNYKASRITDGVATQRFTGTLARITDDSIALRDGRELIAFSRDKVRRLEVERGRRSRSCRAILGFPLGLGIGALIGKPIGHNAVLGFAVLGAPVGFIAGALSGGSRWKQVPLLPAPADQPD